ncbi:hypothetical protein ACUHRZ_005327 [Raoultella planticola]
MMRRLFFWVLFTVLLLVVWRMAGMLMDMVLRLAKHPVNLPTWLPVLA